MRFSERIGAVRRVIQKDSMDEALKNGLWNVIWLRFIARVAGSRWATSDVREGKLLTALWMNHFNLPLDTLSAGVSRAAEQAGDWWAVYDFVEFIARNASAREDAEHFPKECNHVLEKHVSAYRFVGATLAPITSEEEIAAIERGLGQGAPFAPVVRHLETALQRLGDRPVPDARNSIKESISAVEATCQILTGDSKATLGQALKKIGVHGALEKGFSAIYGYTSDANGIRHALVDEPTISEDDARFFLVSCSAFTNYLIAKSVVATSSCSA